MSIRDFNNFIKQPGCIITVSVVSLIAMAGGIFTGLHGCSQDGPNGASGTANKPPVIIGSVGEFQIDANLIENQFTQQNEQMAQYGQSAKTAAQMAAGYGTILDQQVQSGLYLAEADKKGVSITDADITKMLTDGFQQNMDMAKMQLTQSGKLKAGASQADFEKAFQDATGKSLNEVKADRDADIKHVLSDKVAKNYAKAQVARNAVPKALAAKITITDDQLKATFVTLTVKRIYFTGPDSDAQLAKAQAEIKSGTPFTTLIDRYSKDTTNKGKKPSETETTLTRDQLLSPNGPLHALLTMKEGQVTDPIVTNEGITTGKAIYKVIKVKPELPKDFATQKAKLTTDYASILAQAQVQDDLKVLQKSGIVKFTDPAWGALYDLTTSNDASLTPSEKETKIKAVITTTSSLASSNKIAALTYYGAVTALLQDATPAVKAQFEDDRAKSIQAASAYAGSAQDDLELAQILAKRKDAEGALQALDKAVGENAVSDPQAQGTAIQVQLAVQDLVRDKLVTEDQAKTVKDDLAKWMEDKKQYDDEQAQAAKAQQEQMAQQAKEKAEYEKAQKAAADKAKADEKAAAERAKTATPTERKSSDKSAVPSVTGGTPPPATSPLSGSTGAGTAGGLGKGP